jgi:hypothetical protein
MILFIVAALTPSNFTHFELRSLLFYCYECDPEGSAGHRSHVSALPCLQYVSHVCISSFTKMYRDFHYVKVDLDIDH